MPQLESTAAVAQVSQDNPIPSIEPGSNDSVEASSDTESIVHIRTPSVSVSPPPPATANVDMDLASLTLSDTNGFNMKSVRMAIPEAGVKSNSNKADGLEPEPRINSPPTRTRRRRSSSRLHTPRHEVGNEELPHDRFNEPVFQQAYDDARKLMTQTRDLLQRRTPNDDPESTLRRLQSTFESLAHFTCPTTRTVGFVGGSGAGKSSLLNALLDCRGLARASSSGAACTCVVTEYHYHDEDNFVIQVELFEVEELLAQLTQLLQSYRSYHMQRDALDSSKDRAHSEDLERQAGVAIDTFRAMFRGRLQDESFLLGDSEETILGVLKQRAQDSIPSSLAGRQETQTLEECAALLMRLSSEVASETAPSVWPYMKKISVSLKSSILSRGLVLVDLPGLNDTNSARQNVTERHIRECHEVFAVCDIARATTDVVVSSVFDLARRARLPRVGIVCTKSDVYRAEEARDDYQGNIARTIERLDEAVRESHQRLRLVLDELEELDAESDEDLLEEERTYMAELNRRRRSLERLLESRKFQLQQFIMDKRNATVTHSLRETYGKRVPRNDDLRIFCTSNVLYWEHRDDPADVSLPFLRLSNIMSLRKHCISLVSSTQLRTATRYIRDEIPAAIGDLELWVQSGNDRIGIDQRRLIRETLDAIETQLNLDLNGSSSIFLSTARTVKKEFTKRVYQRRRPNAWSESAMDAGYEWSSWHHATYSAFCRNLGDYCTPAVGRHVWNEEAMHEMVTDLDQPFQELRAFIEERGEDTVAHISTSMNRAVESLVEGSEDFGSSSSSLGYALSSQENRLIAEVEDAYGRFETSLTALRTDALSGIRTSLFGQAMEAPYQAAMREAGTGSDLRRKNLINGKLADGTLFRDLTRSFRTQFRGIVDTLQDELQVAVSRHLQLICDTLDLIRAENAAAESEQDLDFRSVVEARVAELTDQMRRIQADAGLQAF